MTALRLLVRDMSPPCASAAARLDRRAVLPPWTLVLPSPSARSALLRASPGDPGSAHCSGNLLALDRLIAMGPGGRLARPDPDGAHAARARDRGQGAAHWLTTGLPLVLLRANPGPALNLDPCDRRGWRHLAGRHAGADLHRPDWRGAHGRARRGGLLLAVLDPAVDVRAHFSASRVERRIVGRPFGAPFSILCALMPDEPRGRRPFARHQVAPSLGIEA